MACGTISRRKNWPYVLESLSPREASEFLIEKARSRGKGGGDNISLAIVKIEDF
jgi:hypothetical protein